MRKDAFGFAFGVGGVGVGRLEGDGGVFLLFQQEHGFENAVDFNFQQFVFLANENKKLCVVCRNQSILGWLTLFTFCFNSFPIFKTLAMSSIPV